MIVRYPGWIPPYEDIVVETFTDSGAGTIIPAPGAKQRLVIEYTTAQNNGGSTITLQHQAGTVTFNECDVPAGEFLSINAIEDGKEWRLPENQPLIVNLSDAGTVVTNTRYWIESA